MTVSLGKGMGVLIALVAAIGWGIACGMLRTHYWPVAAGGLLAAALGFWLERVSLLTPDTVERKDFKLILAAALGFFAVVGVGVASLSALLARWYLPHF